MTVERLVLLIGATVGMTVGASMWMHNLHRDVGDLKVWSEKMDRRMERIEGALGVSSPSTSKPSGQP